MALCLGFDTSNYTTSVALYDSESRTVVQKKRLLPVGKGSLGLKQSDAVFAHVKQLGDLAEALMAEVGERPTAIGVSARPRSVEGSYMPCFLVGETVARTVAAALGVPLYRFSHQEGHIAAALWSVERLDLLQKEFVAFHLSGGTTECLHCDGRGGALQVELYAATRDLNAGQAIDRVGLQLGLSFPCGPALEKLAERAQKNHRARPSFDGPNPSISGLENQCQKLLQTGEAPEEVARYAIAYIQAVVEGMTDGALGAFGPLPLVYAGGVMSNRIIADAIGSRYGGLFARPEFSSDNAAGIALLAAEREGALWQR